MNKDWARSLLADCIARRSPVEIFLRRSSAAPLCCVPLLMSERLALVAPYVDFYPDGYEVVRLRSISAVRAGDREAFHSHIMLHEGILDRLDTPPVSIDSFPALLTDLLAQDEPVIVSGERALLLGSITKVGKKKLRVRYIDGLGRMDAEPTRMPYDDIDSVAFGNRYLRLVVRYAQDGERTTDAE